MKIGIDILPITSKVKTGIGWYTYNLIHNLSKILFPKNTMLPPGRKNKAEQEVIAGIKKK